MYSENIKIIQKVVGRFFSTTYINPFDWEIDKDVINLYQFIYEQDDKSIKKYSDFLGNHLIFAINEKEKKAFSLKYEPTFSSNHAYIEHWDREYKNYPFMTFIFKNLKKQSYTEFEKIFKKFVRMKNENEIKNFEAWLYKKYHK